VAHGDRPADPDQRIRQANSFGAAAEAYDRARPNYPVEAVTDALGPPPQHILDLGAGTGKLTRVVAGAGYDVVAVDPDEGMLEVLGRSAPQVDRRRGTAEAIPADDAAFDAIVAGQAFHWFDVAKSGPEMVRVLRPGGLVALLWNIRATGQQDWIATYDELVNMVHDASRDEEPPQLGPLFTAPQVRWYEHEQRITVDDLVALAESRSYVITAAPDDRERILNGVRDLGDQTLAATGEDTLRLPYRLQVWTARAL
jgi:ubiquinone/menaquinone biosynthesis C-methylase UbiE